MGEVKRESLVGKGRRSKRDFEKALRDGKKECLHCGKVKVLEEFPKNKSHGDGRINVCKECKTLQDRGVPRLKSLRTSEDIAKDIEDGMKTCNVCGERKPFKEYYTRKTKDSGDGVTYCCKSCWSKKARERRVRSYGLTHEEYKAMKEVQDNKCKICGKKGARGRRLHIDHDHSSGKVRGLLCGPCNAALGLLREDEKIVIGLLNYIRDNR